MTGLSTGTGWAQQGGVWIQIEAQPTRADARDRIEDYAARLADVSGHDLGSGWFAIALGPYPADDAAAALRELRARGAIPPDSFVVTGDQFRDRFYPDGTEPEVTIPQVADTTGPETQTRAEPTTPVETRQEALAAEATLTRPEKERLQVALEWAGTYQGAIDAAFGPGTRGAMSDWQAANGYEATGVLTTNQRAALLAAYDAVLDGMDLQLVRDAATGIAMRIPTGVVEFAAYAPPFARFQATGDVPATVLLISQAGDAARFGALYEIMQTLEVIPENGPRARSGGTFTIEGTDADIVSYTYATLEDDEIKGFSLIWPAGDEVRRSRIIAEMQRSFERTDGVLEAGLASAGEAQSVDLVSGLAVRRPIRSRSGFFVDGAGTVVTTAAAIEGCGEVVLDETHVAEVAMTDPDLGLAVLRPAGAVAPVGVARFREGIPRLQSDVAIAGFSYGGVLGAPSVTFGTLSDISGLQGEDGINRLDVSVREGDAGGPVFDSGGAVIGMLADHVATGDRVLPDGVGFSVTAETILTALDGVGVTTQATRSVVAETPEMIVRLAGEVTVLVNCWE